jgi:plastocyanin
MQRALVLVAALAVVVAGCGSSNKASVGTNGASGAATLPSNTAGGSSHTTLGIAADPTGQLKFDKNSLTAKQGTLTINFTNQASLGHNFTIERNGKVVAATPTFQGGSKTLKVGLSPGSYTFLCTVPGHAAAGMKGTLTIS